jgi:hypothetical protein
LLNEDSAILKQSSDCQVQPSGHEISGQKAELCDMYVFLNNLALLELMNQPQDVDYNGWADAVSLHG